MTRRNDLRDFLEEQWRIADAEADRSRDSLIPVERLIGLYRRLDPSEQAEMRAIISEWVLSHDPKRRYDAISIAADLRVREAVDPLRELLREAEREHGMPEAPYDWAWFNRIIAHILYDGD